MNLYDIVQSKNEKLEQRSIENERRMAEEERKYKIRKWQREVTNDYFEERRYSNYRKFITTTFKNLIENAVNNSDEEIDLITKLRFSMEYNIESGNVEIKDSYDFSEVITIDQYDYCSYIQDIPGMKSECVIQFGSLTDIFEMNLLDAINFYYGELQREEHYQTLTKRF